MFFYCYEPESSEQSLMHYVLSDLRYLLFEQTKHWELLRQLEQSCIEVEHNLHFLEVGVEVS